MDEHDRTWNDGRRGSITRRKLLGAAAIVGGVGTAVTTAWQYSGDGGGEYPLTIDDFDGGTIREGWGNAGNHDTTDAYAHAGSHSVYRVDGSSLFDDGSGFEDAFQAGGRFIVWAVYVDEMSDRTTFRLGFNGDGPPAPDNYSELLVDFVNNELLLRTHAEDETQIETRADSGALTTGEWYEIVSWWGRDIVECWVYTETEEEIAHLQGLHGSNYGDYWWLFDEQSGANSVIDNVRFYETHPYTGRAHTASPDPGFDGLFVSTDGSDEAGDGSYENPWGSITHAVERVNGLSDPAGEVLHVLEGTYDESNDSPIEVTVSATEAEPFRVVGHGDPVINLSDITIEDEYSAAFELIDADNVTVDSITFEESGGYGFRVEGEVTNITVEDCTSRHHGNTGFYSRPTDAGERDVVLERCESYGNYNPNSDSADGFALGRYTPYRAVVYEDCVAHHNADDGFDWHFANGNVASGCIAYRNGFDVDSGERNGSGWGFKTGTGDTDRVRDGVSLHRCVAYHNAAWGFSDNGNPFVNDWYNCTAYENGLGDGEDYTNFQLWGTAEHEVRNCLSVAQSGNHIGKSSQHDDRYNSWNDSIEVEDPQFQSEDPDDELFLHLTDESPCIDAGVDVGLEYNGSAPDLGAYEYGLDTQPLL